jgi:recombination protein RecT
MSTGDAFKKLLTGNQREQIAKQLPPGIEADRFIRTALTVVSMNPELLTCTLKSLLGAIMTAAKDGLLPDGKQALIQPYNCNVAGKNQPPKWEKQAQYMPMVRGLIDILYRAGGVAMVDGVAVYQKDKFEYERGDAPRIIHKPYIGADDAGPVVAAYAVVTLMNGAIKREVMTSRDIAAVRAMAKSDTGWKKWPDQFAIKAVIKRAYKQLPTNLQLEQVIQHDNLQFDLEHDSSPEPLKIAAQPGQPTRLQSIINSAQPVQTHTQSIFEPVYFGEDEPLGEVYDR